MTGITNATISFLRPDKTAPTIVYNSILSGVGAYVHSASDSVISQYAMRGLSVGFRIIIEDQIGAIAGAGVQVGDVAQDATGTTYIIHGLKSVRNPFLMSEMQYKLDCEQRAI